MAKSKPNQSVFYIIAALLPFVILALIEVTLRLAGVGKTIPLFMENPASQRYLLPTPDVVKRYFANESLAPNVTIETNFFLKDKPHNGIRIFVQGGSTAAGFPYGFGASIAGMLDYRLKQTFPDRPVEVVNTALSAVNSYTLLDFADEIIEQKPDAVLIYAGHNEYLGILGVGSAYTAANSHAATLMYLKLRELRIFQLMQQAYHHFTKPDKTVEKVSGRTTMAKVAKHKNIPVGSILFQQGLSQYEQNMQLLLSKYREAGIPVLISTIASNLSHQKPFSSAPIPESYAKLASKELSDYSDVDIEQLQILADASDIASLHFKLGQIRTFNQQYDEARSSFEAARQHDLLRFRAPAEINRIIRQLANNDGVNLVDAQRALIQQAPNGIIGESLMLEHLHPTVDGFFEIANSFYEKLQETKLVGDFPFPVSKAEAKSNVPLFAAERYWGEAKIAGLMADYPFTKEPQQPKFAPVNSWSDKLGFAAYKKQKTWLDIAIASKNVAKKTGDKNTYLKAHRLLADALPDNLEYNLEAGKALTQHKEAILALRYLRRVIEFSPKHVEAHISLAYAYAELNQLQMSLETLQRILEIEPENKIAQHNIKGIKQFLAKQGKS